MAQVSLYGVQYSRLIVELTQGRSDVGISVFIPPTSAQVNISWGKNDVRFNSFIPPPQKKKKKNSGYAPELTACELAAKMSSRNSSFHRRRLHGGNRPHGQKFLDV